MKCSIRAVKNKMVVAIIIPKKIVLHHLQLTPQVMFLWDNHLQGDKPSCLLQIFPSFAKFNYNKPNASQVDRASNSASLQRWR